MAPRLVLVNSGEKRELAQAKQRWKPEQMEKMHSLDTGSKRKAGWSWKGGFCPDFVQSGWPWMASYQMKLGCAGEGDGPSTIVGRGWWDQSQSSGRWHQEWKEPGAWLGELAEACKRSWGASCNQGWGRFESHFPPRTCRWGRLLSEGTKGAGEIRADSGVPSLVDQEGDYDTQRIKGTWRKK